MQIAYLFPYVMTHANAPMFWTMNLFLGILVAGAPAFAIGAPRRCCTALISLHR